MRYIKEPIEAAEKTCGGCGYVMDHSVGEPRYRTQPDWCDRFKEYLKPKGTGRLRLKICLKAEIKKR